ncbi:hypothetical protein Tco_0667254 [Tanacetum coccineum]
MLRRKITTQNDVTSIVCLVKKLEKTVKTRQARRKARIVVSDNEEDLEDPSKQGRKIAKINQDPEISLFTAAEEVYTAEKEVSTAEPVSTAGASVSTAGACLAKDKEEREMYSEAEKARLLAKLINKRKRYFATQRAEERRNKPLTQAQQRTYIIVFEATMRRVHTFVPMESESERVIPELAAGSSKRDVDEELVQESSKRLKTGESSVPAEESNDKEEEELEDLVKPLSIIKEKFTSTEPTKDKEREIWVELKRLFEQDTDDELWKLQKHIHDITWRLYDTCGMLVAKLLVEQDSEMSRELLRKIFMQVERPRR